MLSRNQKSQSLGEMNLRVWGVSKRKGMVKHTHTNPKAKVSFQDSWKVLPCEFRVFEK